RVSPWTALAWGLVVSGRVRAGVAVGAATTAALGRRLEGLEHPWSEAVSLAGRGNLNGGRLMADALRRAWWPLALAAATRAGRAGRRAAVLAFAVPVVDWLRTRPPLGLVPWLGLRLADDAAYGAGLWWGSFSHRWPGALVPDLANWPGRRPAVIPEPSSGHSIAGPERTGRKGAADVTGRP
ncbi:MAG TPA: hypothetical protein VFH45_00430, partial [Acidimicrobiales bacterium]|nr:hypothetical protein [Acidimicrobiales bacterium]